MIVAAVVASAAGGGGRLGHHLNLGSGKFPLAGWTNIDTFCDADIQGDFRTMTFRYVDSVRMSHVLEHISWRETQPLLERIRSWMQPCGTIEIEVPDMEEILALGVQHPLWFKYVYGDQSHAGEYHLAGFTAGMLYSALADAGWTAISIERFVSTHAGRDGMPCLIGRAAA